MRRHNADVAAVAVVLALALAGGVLVPQAQPLGPTLALESLQRTVTPTLTIEPTITNTITAEPTWIVSGTIVAASPAPTRTSTPPLVEPAPTVHVCPTCEPCPRLLAQVRFPLIVQGNPIVGASRD